MHNTSKFKRIVPVRAENMLLKEIDGEFCETYLTFVTNDHV